MFPAAIRLVDEIRPKAVMIENVRGFLSAVFEDYRLQLKAQLAKLGYHTEWRLLNASGAVSSLARSGTISATETDSKAS